MEPENSSFTGMVLPNSLEAEYSVLGAMLQDPNAVLQAVETLHKDDFYQPAHQEIFDAMVQLHRDQIIIDLVTCDTELARRGTLTGIGGSMYLVELVQRAPATANVKSHINIVLEKSTLRKLIAASRDITESCLKQS